MAEPITSVLGIVAIKHCGEYDATKHYEKLNVVTYNGSSYCAKDSTIGNLPTNTTYWDLMAEKGEKGDKGDTPVKGTDYYTAADKAELESTLSSDVSDEVTEQLSTLSSATPLVATSTAEMIDTSRIYVNTTDGHWYWYNGNEWRDGGVYQATEISTESISYDLTNFVKKGINQMIIENNTFNGVAILQDKDGWILVNGTATAGGLIQVATFDVASQTQFKFNQIGTRTYPFYIKDMEDNIIATIGASSTSSAFTCESGQYKILMYINNGSTYNSRTFIELYDSSYDLLIRENNWFKPSLTNEPSNAFNTDNSPIINFNTMNALSLTINDKSPFIFDKDNNEFIINNGWLIINDTYFPTINSGYASYKNTTFISDYSKTLDLTTSTSGLNGIFFNIQTCNIKIVPFNKWRDTTEVNKYDYPLMFYFYVGSSQKISDYFFVSNSIKENSYSKKYLSICGVSIDTYAGFIPSGNVSYYNANNLSNVYVTWWMRLLNELNMNLLVNNSWSGSRASTTNGVTSSGVHRCLSLDDGIHTPDYIIIGAFALNEWTNSPIGDYEIGVTPLAPINADLTNETVYNQYADVIETYAGAMATMINRIQKKYPNAKLYAMDSYNYYRHGTNPTYNPSPYRCLNDYNNALYDVCNKFGVEVIKLSECGLTATNSLDYTVDGKSTGTVGIHPDEIGMNFLYKETLKHFK